MSDSAKFLEAERQIAAELEKSIGQLGLKPVSFEIKMMRDSSQKDAGSEIVVLHATYSKHSVSFGWRVQRAMTF
jgi:hypothetical protein